MDNRVKLVAGRAIAATTPLSTQTSRLGWRISKQICAIAPQRLAKLTIKMVAKRAERRSLSVGQK
uniref:Uncharacterized protein n=1 Tax=Desertifilum tharense IPPAS B-1220 TaxID=1781255 RepID=A0ACD5H2E2_9CYAN